MKHRKSTTILIAVAALGVSACTAPPYAQNNGYPNTSSYPNYPDQRAPGYGYVESIEAIAAEPRATGPGLGAIGGAIAGGVLGNQVGSGTGRAVATVGGAVAGGVIGNQVEQRVRGNQPGAAAYRFRVRMDDGTYQTQTQDSHDNLRPGDRVRVENGRVYGS